MNPHQAGQGRLGVVRGYTGGCWGPEGPGQLRGVPPAMAVLCTPSASFLQVFCGHEHTLGNLEFAQSRALQ